MSEICAMSLTRNARSQLIPFLALVILVTAGGWIWYHIYVGVGKVKEASKVKMDKHNISLSTEGMQVGVKDRTKEQYVDQTQKYVVKAWNLRSSQVKGRR